MSERGCFITEWIYCETCRKAVGTILKAEESNYLSCVTFINNGAIIAGRVNGLYNGEEIDRFKFSINKKLTKIICHPLRISIISEDGHKLFSLESEKM